MLSLGRATICDFDKRFPMLFLRAIPFSFAILWRLVLVLPFMVLALIVFGIIGLVFFFALALILPELAVLMVTVVLFAATSVIPTMVGTRLGLQARGVQAQNSYGGLFLPAIGYGLFEGLIGLIVILVGLGVVVVTSPITLSELGNILQTQPDAAIDAILAGNPVTGLVVMMLVGVLFMGMRAALLVPMAAASIGRDPNGSRHTPFMGFGARILSLFSLVLLGYAISTFLLPVLFGTALLFGQGDALGATLDQIESGQASGAMAGLVFIALSVLFWLWAFSLQCAGATLAYLERQGISEIFAEEEAATQRMDTEDLRNLWKSRMPPGRK